MNTLTIYLILGFLSWAFMLGDELREYSLKEIKRLYSKPSPWKRSILYLLISLAIWPWFLPLFIWERWIREKLH